MAHHGYVASPLDVGHGGAASALARAVRPRQWLKNGLLLAAPAAAGALFDPQVLGSALLAVAAFCAVASAGYLVNDVRDAEEDRRHPRKRSRPVASGALPARVALIAAVALLALGLALAAPLGPAFVGVLAGYLALTLSYSLWLREMAVIDLAAVAGCHAVRAAAGGVAVGVPLSRWFLLVTCFGSLFIVVGKRLGDLHELGDEAADARATLTGYSKPYLLHVLSVASAATIAAYGLWAFERADVLSPLAAMSAVALVLFLLRYALLAEQGAGGAPERILGQDRPLGVLALAWVALFLGAVYL